MTRRQAFKIACALAGTHGAAFAKRFGVRRQCIYRLVGGYAKSARLDPEIDAFISHQFAKHGLTVRLKAA